MRSLRAFFDDEAHDFPAHERPAAVGSPASPSYKAGARLTHMAVGVLVGVMAGLGGGRGRAGGPGRHNAARSGA
jgi:hypothetical protein